jgi:deoxyribonuclease I
MYSVVRKMTNPFATAPRGNHLQYLIVLFLGFSLSFGVDAQNVLSSWGATKAAARDHIYFDDKVTLYCGCEYTPRNNQSGGDIDLASCSYDATGMTYQARADVLEWEHVVPASLMPARQFACWSDEVYADANQCSEPGRSCCERTDPEAQKMIFDLHNLAPSVGQVNAQRSNDRYGLVTGETLPLVCDVEFAAGITEPSEGIRGEVARTWLYMYSQHGLALNSGELAMYLRWSQLDPPEQDEFMRNERIKSLQGIGNPYVEAFL